jgi:hypothetical protein
VRQPAVAIGGVALAAVFGEFRNGTADSAAITLIAQIEGLGLVWAITPQMVRLHEQAVAAVELFLKRLMLSD